MRYIIFYLLLSPVFTNCQITSYGKAGYDSLSIKKWKRAVVNLECRKELGDYLDSQATHHTLKEYQQILKQMTGTAIFLEHDGKRYLITNRHVLYDQDMVLQKQKYHIADSVNDPYSIYMKIFRIPSESEIADSTLPEMPLTILSAPNYAQSNYVYSTQQVDLAIISLDGNSRFTIFAELLLKRGYKPIHLSDIDTAALQYGQDLMCVGYPMIAMLGKRTIAEEKSAWYSNIVAESLFTFGKVSLPSISKIYFIGDLSIAPGNSGGPAISHDKMVGIISAQGAVPISHDNGENYPDAMQDFPTPIS
jgi:Trypsin-like peptidase domain